jgi:hypothetical protein
MPVQPRASRTHLSSAPFGFTLEQWAYSLYVYNFANQFDIGCCTDPTEYRDRYSAVVSRPRTTGFALRIWLNVTN